MTMFDNHRMLSLKNTIPPQKKAESTHHQARQVAAAIMLGCEEDPKARRLISSASLSAIAVKVSKQILRKEEKTMQQVFTSLLTVQNYFDIGTVTAHTHTHTHTHTLRT